MLSVCHENEPKQYSVCSLWKRLERVIGATLPRIVYHEHFHAFSELPQFKAVAIKTHDLNEATKLSPRSLKRNKNINIKIVEQMRIHKRSPYVFPLVPSRSKNTGFLDMRGKFLLQPSSGKNIITNMHFWMRVCDVRSGYKRLVHDAKLRKNECAMNFLHVTTISSTMKRLKEARTILKIGLHTYFHLQCLFNIIQEEKIN